MFERHRDELYRAAYRVCRDPETAEDLVQEALLRLMLEIDTRGAPENMRAWLHRVVNNLAISLGRHAAVEQEVRGRPRAPRRAGNPGGDRPGIRGPSGARVGPADAARGARTALVLAASGYAGAEIAAAIGRSDCATRTMMSGPALKLRDQLVA